MSQTQILKCPRCSRFEPWKARARAVCMSCSIALNESDVITPPKREDGSEFPMTDFQVIVDLCVRHNDLVQQYKWQQKTLKDILSRAEKLHEENAKLFPEARFLLKSMEYK